jgi:hypothetical protein
MGVLRMGVLRRGVDYILIQKKTGVPMMGLLIFLW